MIPMYLISGGDTASTFYGNGKGIKFRLIMQQSEYFQTLGSMGQQLEISREDMS